jgi:opacity protein-like surface antigen
MKKVLTVLICSVFIFYNSSAQDSASASGSQSNLHFGLKLAPIISWTTAEIDGLENDGSSIGFAYGLMMDFHFTDNYAFSTGIELSHRSGKSKSDSLSFKYKFQYIDLPIALKLSTNQIGYMKYFGKFGFLPGINVKATVDKDPGEKDFKIGSEINTFNMGLIVGAGAEYNISGQTSLMIELLYNNGFIDIWKESGEQLKTNYFGINLGVYF